MITYLSDEELKWAKDLLKKIDFLQGISEDELADIAKSLEKLTYGPNKVVIFQGEVISKLHLVHSGNLSVTVKTKGESKKVAELKAGDYFGEMSLVESASASATIRTLKESVIYAISNENFEKIIAKKPESLETIKKKVAARKQTLSDSSTPKT